jgi:hypothetical protein
MPDDFPKATSDGVPLGATVRPIYMGRSVNTYPVSEAELRIISSLNSQVTARLSIATLLLGLAVSFWANAVFYTNLTPAGIVATYYLAPLLLVGSVGFGIAGWFARRSRSGEWDRIKSESAPINALAASHPLIAAPPKN